MNISTSEKLAIALEAKQKKELTETIIKAKNGYYDNYKSPLMEPQLQLIEDLRIIGGCDDLIKKVTDGEFEPTKKECEAWWTSNDGKEVSRRIGSSFFWKLNG